MAKLIEYDVTGVEESSGGTGVKVPIGLRVGEIRICEQRSAKTDGTPANDIRVGINMGPDYDWLFTYVGLGPESDWKLAEFIRACGLKDKGKFDPEKQIGKLIRVKVNPGEYGGEYSPVAGRLFPPQNGDKVGSVSMSSQSEAAQEFASPNGEVEEPEVQDAEGPEGFVPSRENDPEIGSYDDWADGDLLAEVEDRGLTLPGGRGKQRDKAITALRADDNEVADAEEEEGAEEGTADAPDDYDEWEIEKLVAEYNDRQFEEALPTFRGRNAQDRQKEAIITALREDDEASPFS